MTKYLTLDKKEKPEGKKTVFQKVLSVSQTIEDTHMTPDAYGNVLYLGNDAYYGDVFKVWDKDTDAEFILFFGEKGDEFND